MQESNMVASLIKDEDAFYANDDKRGLFLFFKRLFDILVSSISLTLLFPVFIVIGILIKLDSKGSIFFKQERIGKEGKIFNLYKFRTMVINADEVIEEMLKNPNYLKEWEKFHKFNVDPRITRLGNFLRKTSLDELPQLINILKGDMSLIGNRPYLVKEKGDMNFYYRDIVKTKPGLTGYWQISGRSNLTFDERLELEKHYSNNMSMLFDLKIFLKTFRAVFKKVGTK